MQNPHSPQISVYKVSGDDALQFLQGQLTQDVSTVNDEWRYTAHCNPKGRVIALFMLFSNEGDYYLATPTELEDAALNGIKKYVMRSKVKFEKLDYSASFDGAKQPQNAQFEVKSDSLTLSIPSQGKLRFSAHADDSLSLWDKARIDSGVPRLYESTLGEFTPEELNLDLTGAVSFTKGCYTGQEIVARMHYLGKAKKRLFKLQLSEQANVGDDVLNSDDKKIGVVVDVVNLTGVVALACLKSEVTTSSDAYFINGAKSTLLLESS